MRQLLLMRHAKSSWDDPKLADHARPLNARGRLAATAMRRAMGHLGLAPDLILVSSARRTLQTLEALEPWDDTPLIEPLDALYLASARQMTEVLNGVPETVRGVLLIGHNPGMHDLALSLVGPHAMERPTQAMVALADGYPTGGLAEFSVPGPWARLGEGGAMLARFISPRDLAEADS